VEPEFIARYVETGRANLIWRDMAWIGDESRTAAQAARCAGHQGKFWEYHDTLYRNQRGTNAGAFSSANLQRFAADLGLDSAAFNTCLAQGADVAAIQQDLTAAREQGITSTPVFLIGEERLAGGQSVARFFEVVDAALARLGQ
jgi:protein-disulfide isomerase